MSVNAGGAADGPLCDLPPPAAVQEPQPQLLPGLLCAVRHPGCAVRLRHCSLSLAGGHAAEAGEFEQMGLEAGSTNLSAQDGWCTSQPASSACTAVVFLGCGQAAAAGACEQVVSLLRGLACWPVGLSCHLQNQVSVVAQMYQLRVGQSDIQTKLTYMPSEPIKFE